MNYLFIIKFIFFFNVYLYEFKINKKKDFLVFFYVLKKDVFYWNMLNYLFKSLFINEFYIDLLNVFMYIVNLEFN